jgi:ribosomal protein L35
MSTKTNKSFTKRIKVRKSGALEVRKPGFNHFNAKKSRVRQLNGRKATNLTLTSKEKSANLPHTKNV